MVLIDREEFMHLHMLLSKVKDRYEELDLEDSDLDGELLEKYSDEGCRAPIGTRRENKRAVFMLARGLSGKQHSEDPEERIEFGDFTLEKYEQRFKIRHPSMDSSYACSRFNVDKQLEVLDMLSSGAEFQVSTDRVYDAIRGFDKTFDGLMDILGEDGRIPESYRRDFSELIDYVDQNYV